MQFIWASHAVSFVRRSTLHCSFDVTGKSWVMLEKFVKVTWSFMKERRKHAPEVAWAMPTSVPKRH